MGFSTSTWAPALRKARTIGGMGDGGRADADQIHLAQKFAPVGDGRHAILLGGPGADLGIGIGDGEQLDARRWTAYLAAVMAAERACADDGGFERSLFRDVAAEEHVRCPGL